ncbi:MAG: malonate transporter [marine bacterium B5-7]|nr:MAG: malonate transporter [marine bacterium B5-7]
MIEVISLVVPFFAVIGCGYLGARLIGESGQQGINNFVLYFALPTLLFSMMARSDLASRFEIDFVTAYTATSIVLFAYSFMLFKLLFGLKRRNTAIYAVGTVYGNTGYMGIPIVVVMMGESASLPVVLSLLIDLAVMLPITAAMIESDDPDHAGGLLHGARSALVGTLKNPLVIAIALGALWSMLKLPLPTMANGFIDVMAAAAAPCALFAMGSSLYGKPLGSSLTPAILVSLLKLIAHPLLLWVALTRVWNVDPEWARPALVAASLPVAVTVFVIARQYQVMVISASTAIVVSSLLSIISVPVFMLILQNLPAS